MITIYDVKVEQFLKEQLHAQFSSFNFIAEESDNRDVIFGDSIIIDPIDGTTNFVNGVPHTCISVGIYREQKPYIGVVYNPILNEMFYAQVGEGDYLNRQKIVVSKDLDLSQSLIATGFPVACVSEPEVLNNVMDNVKTLASQCQGIRRFGAAALDLAYVSKGMFAGFYEMNLNPWDVSAGIILVQEAGGKVTNIDGGEFDFFTDRYVVASNGLIHDELLRNIESV